MVYEYRRQPLKVAYITYKLLSTILVRVPYWVIRYAVKSGRPRRSWSLLRCIQANVLRDALVFGDIGTRTGFLVTGAHPTHVEIPKNSKVKSIWVQPTPQFIAGDLKTFAESANVEPVRIPGYWYDEEGSDISISAAPTPGEKVLYYIHGGGFIAYSAHPRDLLAYLPKALIKSYPNFKRAFAIEYRLTSSLPNDFTNPFPAALLDALAGYAYLVNDVGFSPKDIVVAGDSAGGNLAHALVRYLVEATALPGDIPQPPGALFLISPWSDMGTSHTEPTASVKTCLKSDILTDLDKGLFVHARSNYCGVLGFPSAANSNRYLSPASNHEDMPSVSFKGFPHTFVVAGDAELFVDQIRDLVNRMKQDLGEKVVYHEEPDAVHDYIGLEAWGPEGAKTRQEFGAWLSEVLSDNSAATASSA